MEIWKKVVNRLLSIKSLVTLILTCVFAYLSIVGVIGGELFMTIFTVVIGFYFGSQAAEKKPTE